jgi:hypothetical protein
LVPDLGNLLLLAVATEQEEHLRLKGIAGAGFVEFGQEWILLKHLEKYASAKVVA